MSLESSAPEKRPPGRPRKIYRVTGRKAANLAMMTPNPAFVHSISPPTPPLFPTDSPVRSFPTPSLSSLAVPALTDAEILSTHIEVERRSHHPQWIQPATLVNNSRLFLTSIPRPSPPWTHVTVVRTLDLKYWFDAQLNDYSRGRATSSDLITIEWFGHPGDSPFAANTRRFLVHWVEPSILSLEGRQQAISSRKIVHRWKYRCVGTCAQVPRRELMAQPWSGFSTDVNPSDDDEYEVWDGLQKDNTATTKNASNNMNVQPIISRDHRCEGGVELVLEIQAHDLSVVYIYQLGSHNDASPEILCWSRGMRNEVLSAMRTFGAQPKRIYQEIVMSYRYPVSSTIASGRLFQLPESYPAHRRPTRKQVYNLLPGLKRRGRLDADPFRAMNILAQLNPEKIYNYSPHDYNFPDKDSEFTCALTIPYALETLILHGTKDGLGMDSSWRNKNENRAAVTILIAVDANGHLSPGSVLLSANIKIPTLLSYLQETEQKVIERAKSIVADKECILHDLTREREAIYSISKDIVASETWNVNKWMIDKSSSLLQAIIRFRPSSRVHVCQFHIVQAIQRLDGDNGRVKSAPRMPYRLTYTVVRAFRNLQRCRTTEEFPEFRKQFEKELWTACYDEDIDEDDVAESDVDEELPASSVVKKISKGRLSRTTAQVKSERYQFLLEYFNKYWFSDYWLEYVTDISLPPGETRDGTNNTNNWAESTFLVFDKVFLDMRKNKRIDRLGAIILNEWFPYYEECAHVPARMPSHVQDDIMRAYVLWDANWINPLADGTYRVRFHNNGSAEAVNVNLTIPRCTPCTQFSQTGKYCVHMRAAILYEKNGPVSQWESQESESLRQAVKAVGSAAVPRLHSDYPFHNQLSRMVPELLRDMNYARGTKTPPPIKAPCSHPAAEPTTSPSQDKIKKTDVESLFRTSWIHYTGRPGQIHPLHPRRSRRHVTFQKKRGPKRPARGKNSLFLQSDIRDATAIDKRRELRRQLFLKKKETRNIPLQPQRQVSRTPAGPGNSGVEPAGPDDGLTLEENQIYTPDLQRWDNSQYTLRIEEMDIFVELLNSVSILNDLRTWVGISGSGRLETEVALALQRSSSEVKEETFTHRIHQRFANIFEHLIFIHLTNFHWTIWDYMHLNNTVNCRAVNPIANLAQLESIERETHWAVIHAMRKMHNLPPIQTSFDHAYKPFLTGLQTDSVSCGFWAVFFTLTSMLGLPVDSPSFSTLTIERVKAYLKPIWLAFLQNPGLDARYLRTVYMDLAPLNCPPSRVALTNGCIVARRPPEMETIPTLNDSATSLDPICDFDPLSTTSLPHALSICEQLLAEENLRIVIGPHIIGPHEIRIILNCDHDRYGTNALITDSVINAYLLLMGAEYERRRKYHPEIPDFVIADNLITTVMAVRPTSGTFRPYHQLIGHTLWFPKVNIFEKELVLLPWHLPASSHWILIVIWPLTKDLRVYDSASTMIMRKHKDILKCVIRFLEYEHHQRFPNSPFPLKDWRQNEELYIKQPAIANEQQTDLINCGIHVLHFCRSLCQGKEERFATAPAVEITNLRYEVAYIFSKYKRTLTSLPATNVPIPPDTPIETLTPTPAPQTRPSSPPTPTPPTSPRLNLAEFPIDASLIAYSNQIKSQNPLPRILLNHQCVQPSALDRIEVDMWHMYKHPCNGLFYPGRICAVDQEQGKFEWEILSETVYSPQMAIPDFVGIERVDEYLRNRLTGLYMHQIGIIRWPAVMDDSRLEMAMSAYTHDNAGGNRVDLRTYLSPPKQEILSFLRAQYSHTREILSRRTTTLQALHEEWLNFVSQWPASKRKQMAFEFAESHLQLLDSHDKFIIRHLAVWELFPSSETSNQMDKILGLAQSILGYLCLAHYLKLTPEVAYRLNETQRITRAESPFEKAWKAMEACILYESMEDWATFRENHRFIDLLLPLSRLQIVNGKKEIHINSESSSKASQSSQASQCGSSTMQTSTLTTRTNKNEQPKLQDTPNALEDKPDLPLAQRRIKRKAAINHAFIKGA